jgi:biopolymer transport protein ExbD
MAFSTGNPFRGRRSIGPLSEINIVPLVDVVLVLLIIFMLTAQVMEFGLEIDVPKVKQTQASTKELPVLGLSARGNLYLNEALININDIKSEVARRFGNDVKEVYLRADKQVTWDILSQVVEAINHDAKLKTQLVTKAADVPDRKR